MISLMLSVGGGGGGGGGNRLPRLPFPPHTLNANAHGTLMGVVLAPTMEFKSKDQNNSFLEVISTPNFYSKSWLEITPRWGFI